MESIENYEEQTEYLEHQKSIYGKVSEVFFPGKLVAFHTITEMHKSKLKRTCAFTGASIGIGSNYTSFKFIIINDYDNKFMVSDPISLECSYYVPTSLQAVESLQEGATTDIKYNNDQEITEFDAFGGFSTHVYKRGR